MPQFTQLGSATQVVLEAIDPTTGLAVSGVVVSGVDIWADVNDGPGGSGANVTGAFMLVPGPNA